MVYLLLTLISWILVPDGTEIEILHALSRRESSSSCSSRISQWHKQLRIIFFFPFTRAHLLSFCRRGQKIKNAKYELHIKSLLAGAILQVEWPYASVSRGRARTRCCIKEKHKTVVFIQCNHALFPTYHLHHPLIVPKGRLNTHCI